MSITTATPVNDSPHVKRTILVADSSEHTRYRIARALTKEGHRVTTASDADEAMAAASVFRVDLLLADVDLPGTANGNLLQAMRDQNGGHCPVAVALATKASPRAAGAATAGFSACLFKPLNEAELKATARRALESCDLPPHPAPARHN